MGSATLWRYHTSYGALPQYGVTGEALGGKQTMAKGNKAAHKPFPRTVSEAIDRILSVMNEFNKARLREMRRDDLSGLHISLGLGIRNEFGLWRGNKKLLASCGLAGDASSVIIEALWRRLQN